MAIPVKGVGIRVILLTCHCLHAVVSRLSSSCRLYQYQSMLLLLLLLMMDVVVFD